MSDLYSRLITRHARKVLWILTGVTLVMGACVLRLRTNNAIETWLLDDDPRRESYREFVETFGTEEFVLVVFSDEDLFSKDSFRNIHQLSERLKAADGVSRVWSLTEIYREILSRLPPGASLSPDRFKEAVIGHPLFDGNIISDDGSTTAVAAFLTPEGVKDRRGTVKAIRMAAELACPGKKLYFAGPPVMSAELDRIASRDPRLFTPLVVVFASALLLALFRSRAGVRLPLAVAGMSIVWALGVFSLIGGTMNLVLAVMPPLILVAAVGDSIHLLCRYQHHARASSPETAILEAVREVWRPCLMTSLTTAIGFGSLGLSRFSPVRNFGLLSILGIVFAFIITMTLAPASIVFRRGAGLSAFSGDGDRIGRMLSSVGRFNAAHPVRILLLFALGTLAGIVGLSRLNVEANTLKFFPADGEIRRTYAFIEERLTGLGPFEIMLRGEVDSPETFAAIDRIEDYLVRQPYVTHSFSVRALQAGFGHGHPLPPVSGGMQVPAVFGGLLHSFVSPDGKTTRISGRGLTMSSVLYDRAMDEIEKFARGTLPEGVTAELTGVVPMITSMDRYLLATLIKSFSIAITIIGALMAFNFRSIRLGLLSMIPNAAPIAATLGVMGFLGIDLSPATATVAGISLGIAVDDTIHYLHRYSRFLGKGLEPPDAAAQATETIGRPMLYTTLTLAVGFMVMGLSDFGPTRHFGFLSAFCIMLALICDLFLLPALLILLRPGFCAAGERAVSNNVRASKEFRNAL